MNLHKSPSALLAAFDLKVTGQNPDQFSEQVSPVVDVYDHYMGQQTQALVTANGTITTPATSGIIGLVVPNQQVYRTLAWSVDLTVNAADAAITSWCNFAMFSPVLATWVYLPPIGQVPTLGRVHAHYAERPLMIWGGWRLSVGLFLSAAPTVPVTFRVRALVQVISENP